MTDSQTTTRPGASAVPAQGGRPDGQTALLGFRGPSFPHVTVGTLIKAF
jgi:hypothetical protein